MFRISVIYLLTIAVHISLLGRIHIHAIPVEEQSIGNVTSQVNSNNQSAIAAPEVTRNTTIATNATAAETDLQTSNSEETSIILPGAIAVPDGLPTIDKLDPSIYAGLMAPDAFQQYVNQYGASFPPPYTGYPAPVGYAPPGPIFPPPPPYVVQTGYEGYLVPTTTTTAASTTANSNTGNSTSGLATILNPLTILTQLFPMLLNSNIFRIVSAIISGISMILMGGLVTTLICNLTPLCDISFKAVTYLRRKTTAGAVGRLIANEVTPERVRRATEFVRNAIRKYRELQKVMDMSTD